MTELQLRIFAPDGGVSRVEALRDGSALAVGQASFDPHAFRALNGESKAYGIALRDALFASEPIRRAYGQAISTGELRLRLQIDPDAVDVHTLCWERLILPVNGEDVPASASPRIPFSRYVALDSVAPVALSGSAARVLLAVASPSDLRQLTPIDVQAELENLIEAWKELLWNGEMHVTVAAGSGPISPELRKTLDALGCTLVEKPVTADLLGEMLADSDALHLIAHGNLTPEGKAVLALQREDGTLALAEEDFLFAKLNLSGLRFVFLHSCKSSGSGAHTGLAPRLVQLGVPGVVAMQDFVPMLDAREFSSAFYRALLREGAADVAANAGRQAILRASSTNWSIPVLFSRLKDGQIWQPDPLRTVTRHISADYRMDRRVQNLFPLDAIYVRNGLTTLQHGADNARGPKLALTEASTTALEEMGSRKSPFLLLIGNRGRAKTTHLKWLYSETALHFLETQLVVPSMLSLAGCTRTAASPERTVAAEVARNYAEHGFDLSPAHLLSAFEKRSFLFLIDGDSELSAAGRADAIGVLRDFHAAFPKHRFLLTADGSLFDWTLYPEDSLALVIQPMRIDRVIEFLEEQESPAVRNLVPKLRESALFDLVEVPWLLSSLMDDAEAGACIDSRKVILERFVRESMARVGGPPGVKARAEEVLNRIGWKMQSMRAVDLAGPELYGTLAEVRGNREYSLEDFLAEIQKSGLLVNSGDESGRFAYAGLQSFFCARFLNRAEGRARLLEDITATLGRGARLRWWADTLVLLAGMTSEVDSLIRMILAGSALTEGEQIFLAARCLHEARRSGVSGPAGIGQDIADQIVDTLIWRSLPANVRSVSQRAKAIGILALIQEPRVVSHLFSIALEKVRADVQGNLTFDYSIARCAAVLALRSMPDASLALARSDERYSGQLPLQKLMVAWFAGDLDALGDVLTLDDPCVSAVAAFALGTFKRRESLDLLVRHFASFADRKAETDILWAVADTLCLLNPVEVTARAVLPALDKPRLAMHAAYMIGRLGVASLDGPECAFLRRALLSGNAYLASRALRSYAAVLSQQQETPGSALSVDELRALCHELVADDRTAAARRACINLSPYWTGESWWHLRYQAFEALRSIGDATSVEVLRRTRRSACSPDADRARLDGWLNQLSFEIGEEIYWRLTGGLAGDSYSPLAAVKSP